ncbi:MAG: transketolase [Alphaproteobacteria bacterium]
MTAILKSPSVPDTAHRDVSNAIRFLAADAVEAAKSGHPGMPMGMADVASVLWGRFLKFNPADPHWPDRDRFVLSAGHGSMLLYAINYLTGYEAMSLDEIKHFRQGGSKTPGHPEHDLECGIETTTGPLGQGFGNAVGMALAERIMAARFGAELVDHHTYVIASDGDLMEGISHEAASLAGHLKLNRLIVYYDDNEISIDGPTSLSFSDDTLMRFTAYGWAVQAIDGHDPEAIAEATKKALASDRPSLIACRTIIGYGAPTKAGTKDSHGSALGAAELAATREKLSWPHEAFTIPDSVLQSWRGFGKRSQAAYDSWAKRHQSHEKRAAFDAALSGDIPAAATAALKKLIDKIAAEKPSLATRQCSGNTLEVLLPEVPELIGGSADLTGSVNTQVKNTGSVSAASHYAGRYIHYGVREHGMAAAMNGMALHGGIIPYSGTFLQFADYCRPSIRLAALMKQRAVFVMTHDSIGLGEDGPTHQPVEHLAGLRAVPDLYVFRPADGIETAECWAAALALKHAPSVMTLTRQALPTLRGAAAENLSARGGYVLAEADGARQVTLLATGSELYLAVEAQAKLKTKNIRAAVVSLPCWELFEEQDAAYRAQVLGQAPRIGIEAAGGFGWERYLGSEGVFIGMKGFGASAPAPELYKQFGITTDAVVAAAEKLAS